MGALVMAEGILKDGSYISVVNTFTSDVCCLLP